MWSTRQILAGLLISGAFGCLVGVVLGLWMSNPKHERELNQKSRKR